MGNSQSTKEYFYLSFNAKIHDNNDFSVNGDDKLNISVLTCEYSILIVKGEDSTVLSSQRKVFISTYDLSYIPSASKTYKYQGAFSEPVEIKLPGMDLRI